jgi:hypothetical protein
MDEEKNESELSDETVATPENPTTESEDEGVAPPQEVAEETPKE